jgi:hypothetical protein
MNEYTIKYNLNETSGVRVIWADSDEQAFKRLWNGILREWKFPIKDKSAKIINIKYKNN